MTAGRPKLVLASGSPRRLALLAQIGVQPERLMPVSIDETPKKHESARNLAKRLAEEKAAEAVKRLQDDAEYKDALVLAADTVVSVGRRVLPKAESVEQATSCLRLLSGRAHRVYTAIAFVAANRAVRRRLIETRVRFKRLSREEIDAYLASGEWRDKAGGYAIQGIAGAFVVKLVGSYTGVVGLPLYETMTLLSGDGYPVQFSWLSGGLP